MADRCSEYSDTDSKKIDCWYKLIQDTLERKGLTKAMGVFTDIYSRHPLFARSGCHRHAHHVGDLAYYQDYVAKGYSLEEMDFPQETASCGYGFYHGFLEHLVQDRPTAEFITKTCEYLTKRLSDRMRDIQLTCYHGSGHGLTLAQAEKNSKKQWGDVHSYVDGPLSICNKLTLAHETDVKECKEGVFNVLVDWMEAKELGFAYDVEKPFSACNGFQPEEKKACYYEMSMKLNGLAVDITTEPSRIVDLIKDIEDTHLRDLAFRVAITGMIQSTANTDAYIGIIRECSHLNHSLFLLCLRSVISGLFEHGPPRSEYLAAINVCQLDFVRDDETIRTCWDAIFKKLRRFYGPDEMKKVCPMFPTDKEKECVKTLSGISRLIAWQEERRYAIVFV